MDDKFYISKKPPKLRGEDNHTVVSVRMPDRLMRKLEQCIIKTNRNRSQLIIMALDYALERLVVEESEESEFGENDKKR
jgi:metal-responsive CopG/Arc/MetJ family transcriptional regulator